MHGERLPGGRVTGPHRVGDVVHRRPAQSNPAALAALRLLEAAGWSGAPRLVHADSDGAQVVTYLPGRVPWQQPVPPWAATDEALSDVARLVREFHDLTAGELPAGDQEVLCHNDLDPSNTVYHQRNGGRPYGFIDWDLAAPGRRIDDVAHVCWTWLDLGPRITDLPGAARGIAHIVSAYGADWTLADVVAVISWWQHRCWRGIEDRARAGSPAMRALVADGTAAAVRRAATWTDVHAAALSATV